MAAESTLRGSPSLAVDAIAEAANGRFVVRPASAGDIQQLATVEREAFPEQWPPTRFASEIRKPDALYLVAVAPAAPPDASEVPPGPGSVPPTNVAPLAYRPTPGGLRSILRMRLRPPWLSARPAFEPPPSYLAGFVGIWFVVDEAHIVSIGVRKAERRQGVGELLLLGAFHAARRRQMKELTLEVRKSNAGARALYTKYGFREVGVRRKYYVDNGEDAIIMTTPHLSTPEFAQRLQHVAREHAERWGDATGQLPR
jgi:ribosomal-protein-alanine N-acetyltransferase